MRKHSQRCGTCGSKYNFLKSFILKERNDRNGGDRSVTPNRFLYHMPRATCATDGFALGRKYIVAGNQTAPLLSAHCALAGSDRR
jgi:hypothetical protein